MAPGRKTGGRQKGTPNKVNSVAREAFLATFGRLEGDLETWIRSTAETDPGRAADLLIRMAEYHFPKLARAELSSPNGDPFQITIIKPSLPKES